MVLDSVASDQDRRQIAAEDLKVGMIVAERKVVLDDRAFAMFSALTGDKHPIHYSDDYARSHGLRAPISHGLLIVAMTALGATEVSERLYDSMIAMVGVNAKFLSPVYLGEAVVIRIRVGDLQLKSKGLSLVRFDVDIVSEDNVRKANVSQAFLLKSTLT